MIDRLLPSNAEAERLVLGAILMDAAANLPGVAHLMPADFSIEAHRRIYSAIEELNRDGAAVDRMTVANELNRREQLESVGVAYLTSLDDGLPRIYNLDSYARMVSDCALRRRFMMTANRAIEAVARRKGMRPQSQGKLLGYRNWKPAAAAANRSSSGLQRS